MDAGLVALAEQIEGVLEQAGRRGMSPAAAARRIRRTRRVGCTAADARAALAWLNGKQYANTDTHHPGRYHAGRAR